MPFIVIHADSDDIAQYRQFDDVHAAAGYIEELHNLRGISDARLFALDEVEFAVTSYVKVEIADLVPDAAPRLPVAVEAVTRAVAQDVEEPAEDNDAIAYVEAPTLLPDLPVPIAETEPAEERVGTSEVRRGLFGR